jgi:hypothetical protein
MNIEQDDGNGKYASKNNQTPTQRELILEVNGQNSLCANTQYACCYEEAAQNIETTLLCNPNKPCQYENYYIKGKQHGYTHSGHPFNSFVVNIQQNQQEGSRYKATTQQQKHFVTPERKQGDVGKKYQKYRNRISRPAYAA